MRSVDRFAVNRINKIVFFIEKHGFLKSSKIVKLPLVGSEQTGTAMLPNKIGGFMFILKRTKKNYHYPFYFKEVASLKSLI